MVQWAVIEGQNPWWSGTPDNRLAELEYKYSGGFERKKIYDELTSGSVHLLKGPRQSGKTTYLLKLIKDVIQNWKKPISLSLETKTLAPRAILYFSAEGRTTVEVENVLRNFFSIHSGFEKYLVCIDEITSIGEVDGPKGWASNIKKLFDNALFSRSSLILTGSDANKLEQGGRVMLGRGVEGNTHYLAPLAFREYVLQISRNHRVRNKIIEKRTGPRTDYPSEQVFLQEENKLKRLEAIMSIQKVSLNNSLKELSAAASELSGFTELLHFLLLEYIKSGGFPEAITTEVIDGTDESKMKIYEKTINSVLEKIELSDLSKENAKRILLWILDARAQTISYAGIGKDVGLKVITVEKYLEALEQLQLITVLTPLVEPTKVTYLKKAYLSDPMLEHSLRISRGEQATTVIEKALTDEKALAQLIEEVVCSALRQHAFLPILKEVPTFLHFGRKANSNKELDFIFSRETGTKLGIEVKYQENTTKRDVRHFKDIGEYVLVTKNNFELWNETQIALPAHVLLAMLPTSKAFL